MAKRSVLSTLHLVAAVERGGAQALRASRHAARGRGSRVSCEGPAKMGGCLGRPHSSTLVGWREWVEPARHRRAVAQGQDRHRRAHLVAARLRHRGVRARRRAVGALHRAPVAGLRPRTRTTVECPVHDRRERAQLLRPRRASASSCSLDLSLAGRTVPAEVTLSNRHQMGFRMLVGREALRQGFVVDPSRSYAGGRPPRTSAAATAAADPSAADVSGRRSGGRRAGRGAPGWRR